MVLPASPLWPEGRDPQGFCCLGEFTPSLLSCSVDGLQAVRGSPVVTSLKGPDWEGGGLPMDHWESFPEA